MLLALDARARKNYFPRVFETAIPNVRKLTTIDGAGAVAQLGERYDGIVEVRGSIPLSSTINHTGFADLRRALSDRSRS